jgi:hypothetical protein
VSSYSKFLRRVRIHGRECGAVARALPHKIEANPLSAADKKVLSTTNERKVMSKTTFFKRIALTAIAALGFGMLSVAPSQAVVTANTISIDSATDEIDLGETATAVITHSFTNLGDVNDSVTIVGVVTSSNASSSGNIAMRVTDSYTSIANDGSFTNSPSYMILPVTNGETATNVAEGGLLASNNRSDRLSDSLTVGYTGSANRSIGTQISVDLYKPTQPGTYTITFYTLTSTGGATAVSSTPSVTWTVTVSAAAVTAATSASSVTLRNGNVSGALGTYFGGTAEGTDSQTLASRVTSTTSTSPSFQLYVKQKDGTATNVAQESYTVQVTGEAFVTRATSQATATLGAYSDSTAARPTYTGSNGVTGTKYLRMATPVADSATIVNVWSTGTAGTATITVTTDGGVVLGTKTITFHGPATALAVTSTIKKVLQAGSATAITSVLSVTATDALGYKVTGVSPVIVSSNLSAVSTGSCTDASSSSVTDGVYSCTVNPVVTSTSGMAATLTIRIPDPAVTTATAADGPYLSTTYDVTMGGAVSTFVLTTDNATYEPGTAMVVTATAKDSSGNTPYDGQDGPTLRANKQLGGTAAGTTITMNAYYDGVSTSQTRSSVVRTMSAATTLYAPAASGAFTVSGLDAQTTPVEVKVTATVGDDGATAAANAASDAAAEAIDAANAATDAANLAAEAADAATVAAEEARDAADAATAAVEALATEVATLMAALKAQITTLANTVAKIAKKVKA